MLRLYYQRRAEIVKAFLYKTAKNAGKPPPGESGMFNFLLIIAAEGLAGGRSY
jgi:hypothetical protein